MTGNWDRKDEGFVCGVMAMLGAGMVAEGNLWGLVPLIGGIIYLVRP